MTELSYASAIILGLIQGLTEFLPVSSSGHLVIAQRLLGLGSDSPAMLLFDVVTHVGTLLAVGIVFAGTFRKFVVRLATETAPGFSGRRSAWIVAGLGMAACAVTGIIGFGFKDAFERSFSSTAGIGGGLLATGTMLFLTGRIPRARRGWRRIGWWRAALVGAAQGIAILPGVSRSGSTICVALFLGMRRQWAAQFSFLIVVPAILGAGAVKLRDTFALPSEQFSAIPWGPITVGAAVSLLSGVLALRVLLAMVIGDRLQHFCYYCWGVGAIVLVWCALGLTCGLAGAA